ncbi:uncharacterized protein LOC123407548 [Hordeum vulgare subsp. vulgare]|uniref:uncharacterized protein LOC123407548 n=1 Tax=Hordeum vulgare subsp. vulgare TaxID=112509 RepID=UPI001D1A3A45|nr:uncharacterized protein LOC123407548 [Hordeum vulgare subsp. vulgare]
MTPRHTPIQLDSALMDPNPTHNLCLMARVSGVRLHSRLPCRPPLICCLDMHPRFYYSSSLSNVFWPLCNSVTNTNRRTG